MMYKLFFYTSLFFLAVVGCSEDDNYDDCASAVCTLELRSFYVTLTDSNNDAVALDTFKVTDIINGRDLDFQLTDDQFLNAQQSGMYPLFEDRFKSDYKNTSTEIVFKGFINGIEVVSANFIAGADCCHVEIFSGDLEIVIN